MDTFTNILSDLKERFLTMETAWGFYLIGLGLAWLLFPTLFATVGAFGAIGLGGYHVYVNRIKKADKEEKLLAERRNREQG